MLVIDCTSSQSTWQGVRGEVEESVEKDEQRPVIAGTERVGRDLTWTAGAGETIPRLDHFVGDPRYRRKENSNIGQIIPYPAP